MTKAKKARRFNIETLERLTIAMLNNQVNDMRHNGLTDRAIARKLNLPRWMVRMVSAEG